MPELKQQIEQKILSALTQQRAKFDKAMAAKNAEIAALKSQLVTASARLKTLLPAVAQPKGCAVGGPTGGLARMAAGIKLPSKG